MDGQRLASVRYLDVSSSREPQQTNKAYGKKDYCRRTAVEKNIGLEPALTARNNTNHTQIRYNMRIVLVTALLAASVSSTAAFMPWLQSRPTVAPLRADTWDASGGAAGAGGSIEQIEFKIHADGRVEETVRGVKGNNCHKVTEKINEALGKVVASQPTEEMFQEEVAVTQKIYQSESDWEGSSSW